MATSLIDRIAVCGVRTQIGRVDGEEKDSFLKEEACRVERQKRTVYGSRGNERW